MCRHTNKQKRKNANKHETYCLSLLWQIHVILMKSFLSLSAKPGTCPVVTRRSCRVKPEISPDQVPCGDSVGKRGRTPRENDWDCPGEQKCCLGPSACHFLCQHPPNSKVFKLCKICSDKTNWNFVAFECHLMLYIEWLNNLNLLLESGIWNLFSNILSICN